MKKFSETELESHERDLKIQRSGAHVQCLNIGFSRGINHGENVRFFMSFIHKTHEAVAKRPSDLVHETLRVHFASLVRA